MIRQYDKADPTTSLDWDLKTIKTFQSQWCLHHPRRCTWNRPKSTEVVWCNKTDRLR